MTQELAYRNPNGLQPFSMFPEDYSKRGTIHYNIPPVRLERETMESVLVEPKYWHGYTGAKTFFTHQPLPSTIRFSVYGGTASDRMSLKSYRPSVESAVQQTACGVPYNITTAAALHGASAVGRPQRPQIHPMQVDVPDSRLWRFDGRNHTFKI
ncbi:hypothetical protein EG68_06425 [Paragonimus skrjabini miyazakii]|uniref:Uncharacterized protein n=1 Tax=Paragonimus skrjabini miyazakii TaxID=59628 RepID=A0A8S9YWH2_9TREM|nr:hypothetical protein EG68_06425 [Paragonimus skrjabini miyazakii]